MKKWFYNFNSFEEIRKYLTLKYDYPEILEFLKYPSFIEKHFTSEYVLASDEIDSTTNLKFIIRSGKMINYHPDYTLIDKKEFEEIVNQLEEKVSVESLCSCGRKGSKELIPCTCQYKQEQFCNCCSKCRSK